VEGNHLWWWVEWLAIVVLWGTCLVVLIVLGGLTRHGRLLKGDRVRDGPPIPAPVSAQQILPVCGEKSSIPCVARVPGDLQVIPFLYTTHPTGLVGGVPVRTPSFRELPRSGRWGLPVRWIGIIRLCGPSVGLVGAGPFRGPCRYVASASPGVRCVGSAGFGGAGRAGRRGGLLAMGGYHQGVHIGNDSCVSAL